MWKTFCRCVFALTSLILVLGLGAMRATAAEPPNTEPDAAAQIDNQTHSIQAHTSLWYYLEYAGDRSQIVITLVDGNAIGLAFNLFTPAQIDDWWNVNPVGRGTLSRVNCITGCQPDDLAWQGSFNTGGAYFVQVLNPQEIAHSFLLTVEGTGILFAPPLAAPAATAQPSSTRTSAPALPSVTAQPSQTLTASPTLPASPVPTLSLAYPNIDPVHAALVDSQPHTVPGNTSLWYRFIFQGGHSQIVIILANGGSGGLHFNIWTPAQIPNWWDPVPIGRGVTLKVDCVTGRVQANGSCDSSELVWVGKLNAGGTYYVQVSNPGPNPVDATLTVQGDGVLYE